MLIVALLFATFYSEYLNFYELVNNSANTRIAARINVLEMGGWRGVYFARLKTKVGNQIMFSDRCCLAGKFGRLIFDCV